MTIHVRVDGATAKGWAAEAKRSGAESTSDFVRQTIDVNMVEIQIRRIELALSLLPEADAAERAVLQRALDDLRAKRSQAVYTP